MPEYEEDTATLVVKKMSMDFDGDYKCVAENSAGTTETLAKITVEGEFMTIAQLKHSILHEHSTMKAIFFLQGWVMNVVVIMTSEYDFYKE